MSLGSSLTNAVSGLSAASRMAEVVSSNLANALTEGYARRIVDLSSQDLGGRGGGVQVDGLSRVVDRGILSDRRLADAAMARDIRIADAWSRLEAIAGTAASPDSMTGQISRLESALVAAGSDPSASIRLEDVLASLKAVTEGFAGETKAITGLRNQADADIAADVQVLNTSLVQIARVNDDITEARLQGRDATALMDARQRLVDTVSAIVPVRSIDRSNGQIALVTTSGSILLDGKASTVGFAQANAITPAMTFANGALSGLTLNGAPIPSADGFSRFDGGSLGAAFRLRDQVLPNQQLELDSRAADLIARFESANIDPTWTTGNAGLLTDRGGPLNSADITGLAGRIGVNAAVNPARGGALWRLRDGTAATAQGPVGGGAQIERWGQALVATTTLGIGGTARGAAGHAADRVTLIGGARASAEATTAFSAARQGALKSSELALGVDSDAELQNLMMIEKAYAANAKVIETVDGLLRRLLEM